MRIRIPSEVTWWTQFRYPVWSVGIHQWHEIGGRDAVTFFVICIGITIYWRM